MDPNNYSSGGRPTLSDSVEGLPVGNSLVGKPVTQATVKRQAVKRHHHKHNLKHRYEFLETLGKGTYGKVKKAVERSGRMVSFLCLCILTCCLLVKMYGTACYVGRACNILQ